MLTLTCVKYKTILTFKRGQKAWIYHTYKNIYILIGHHCERGIKLAHTCILIRCVRDTRALRCSEVQIVHTHFLDSCFELHALYIYMSRYLAQLWNLHEDSLWTKSIILRIMLLLLSLKSINHEWWGLKYLWVYMYVH